MEVNIEMIPSYRIAYFRQIGPYGNDNRKIMEKLKDWAKSNRLLNDEAIILGIAQDNPQTTKPEDCRYDTCLVIPKDYCIHDDNINKGKVIGGKYAVFVINHTAEAVGKAWNEIFPELYKQGYQIDNTKPVIERYATKMVKSKRCEIGVPIM